MMRSTEEEEQQQQVRPNDIEYGFRDFFEILTYAPQKSRKKDTR